MKKVIFLMLLALVGCASRKSLTIKADMDIKEGHKLLAQGAAAHWRGLYGCKKRIKLIPLDTDSAHVIEEAGPGWIAYGGGYDIKSVVLHSMTHACKPDKPTLIKRRFLLGQDTVVGFHGLNLLIRTKDGEDTYFTKMEEGVAERAAIFAGMGYTSYNFHYVNLATITKNRFPKDYQPDPVKFVKNNDVYGFVAEFLNKPRAVIRPRDVVEVVNVYQWAWSKTQLIPERYHY